MIEPWIAGRGVASCSLLFLLSCLSTPIKIRFSIRMGCIFYTCNIERNRTADFGVDAAEQAWLDGASQTHVLFGKLRIFSFE
jgi:hypothetical protein